jgi:two-component system chemotaxis response regulator CheB
MRGGGIDPRSWTCTPECIHRSRGERHRFISCAHPPRHVHRSTTLAAFYCDPVAMNEPESSREKIVAERIPIVVIGASAGGVEALTQLVRTLPNTFPGAIFVAMHFPAYGTSVLPSILERAGNLPARHAEDGQAIEAGRIYVAPPDRHLILLRRNVRLARGPRENGNRPAIDPMFRSAAVAHGAHAIGVVLTGNLDDGTSGLLAIKRRGGIAVVQDPDDALFPSMPSHAIELVDVDFVLPLVQVAPKLIELATTMADSSRADRARMEEAVNDDAEREARYAELDLHVVEDVKQHPGHPSQFGCPDCGGVLWEIQDSKLVRYRCRVGHAWSAEGLLSSQAEQLDQALWTALRALEESASLTGTMAARARHRGNDVLAARFDRDARIATERAHVIRDALLANPPAMPAGQPGGDEAVG